ncbi:MAG TPA: hypothetical protein DEG69_19810 [Flavobacteriaceae bacterium]|nr:hypothetical protein [Flavobacteriaceae bacterium]
MLVVRAQQVQDSISGFDLNTIAQLHQENSYITFPTDIGNMADLWFEGNINPAFTIRNNKKSRLLTTLTPQVIIRMYRENSYPVRTPSYIPQLTLYYITGNKKGRHNISLFAKAAHHSNGQEGAFYRDDGSINTRSGNFSTNFFEFGIIDTHYWSRTRNAQYFKSSLELHPKAWMADELVGQYSRVRWHNEFGVYNLGLDLKPAKNRRANISFIARTTWMADGFNDYDTFDIKRLNFSATVFYHPNFLEDVGFFMKFYHGFDYYNIYFNERIDVLRFGIMIETLKFK